MPPFRRRVASQRPLNTALSYKGTTNGPIHVIPYCC